MYRAELMVLPHPVKRFLAASVLEEFATSPSANILYTDEGKEKERNFHKPFNNNNQNSIDIKIGYKLCQNIYQTYLSGLLELMRVICL